MQAEIPTWLDCPADGDLPNPPVETRQQGLPFNKLSWQNFERLILRLVRRESTVLGCEIYGTAGQAQEGIDVLAIPTVEPTKRVCYQCKKVEKFDPSDIRAAVDTFLNGKFAKETQEFVLCVACSLSSTTQVSELSTQRERLQKQGISFVIWDGSDAGQLCEKLKQQPELVDDFFGRAWVQAFNGEDAAKDLGQRLDVSDMSQLRARLKMLYTTLFNQHDPGLRTTSGVVVNYLHRYVLADIAEKTKLTTSQFEKEPNTSTTVSKEKSENKQPTSTVTTSFYESRRSVFSWLKDQKNCVVLGDAGYGKSALLRHLTLSLLRQDDVLAGQLRADQLQRLPVWMSFAAFTAAIDRVPNTSVEDHFREWLHQNSFNDLQALFERSLRSSAILLLVDGLDEATNQAQAHRALDRIASFVQSTNAIVICTSRPRGFNSLGIPSTWENANLAPLSDQQIRELSTRWFALTEHDIANDQNLVEAMQLSLSRAETFLAAVRANARTHQLAQIPLLCQTLIELFRSSHRLPEERNAIYSEIITLLLSRHPDARSRAAGTEISLDSLNIRLSEMREILIRLAWDMQSNGRVIVTRSRQLETVCASYLEDEDIGLGLKKPEARRRAETIITALVSRFGLLVEKSPQELGFVHLSIQEYLAAEAVCRKTDEEQLQWIKDVWMQPVWRECLVNWFGILGAQGKKTFAGKAVNQIAELGDAGEFERTQALELRAELACADIGLPVSEARKIIGEIAKDIEKSPFMQHRMVLAKNLTIGALGSKVQDECSALIRKWLPGRPSYSRAEVLSALKAWQPADDLQTTLIQAIYDEEFVCRHAAAQTLAEVFAQSNNLPTILTQIAQHEIRPQVRASALRALGHQPTWAEQALACANFNQTTNCAELILETVKVRVKQHQHDTEDLQRMAQLWSTEAIEYWQRTEFYDVLFDGWSDAPKLKDTCIALIRKDDRSRMDENEMLIYLMRAYPGDDELAKLISDKLRKRGMHFASDKSALWPVMRESFRGHPLLVPSLRDALAEYRKQYEPIFWHPETIGAYWVIGDDATRDELLNAYSSAKDSNNKFWIARTLFEGWADDVAVQNAMSNWAKSSIELSAPLASWASTLFENIDERRVWLENLIRGADLRSEHRLPFVMLKQFPDEQSVTLVRQHLLDTQMWYYNSIQLDSQIAAMTPNAPDSQAIFTRSLGELDGPPISGWAASVENLPAFRSRVLAAAAPASVEVRSVIATTLRERMTGYDQLIRLIPEYIAEENGSVRTTTLLALVKSVRSIATNHDELCNVLTTELNSSGVHHSSRRKSALAGLLELGLYELAAELIKKSKLTSWSMLLMDSRDPDPISLNTIVANWELFEPELIAHELPNELPIHQLISAGYGALFDQSHKLKHISDTYLPVVNQNQHWNRDAFYELLAHRYPRSNLLRSSLVQELQHGYGRVEVGLTIMRLLVQHFRTDNETLELILNAFSDYGKHHRPTADGVLGYLVSGWPDVVSQGHIDTILPSDKGECGPRDRLLIRTAWGDTSFAENDVCKIIEQPIRFWPYRKEDSHILREWATNSIASDLLQQWTTSNKASLSMTAISLLNDQSKISCLDQTALRAQFNQQGKDNNAPQDGLDAILRRNEAWCVSAYPALVAGIGVE